MFQKQYRYLKGTNRIKWFEKKCTFLNFFYYSLFDITDLVLCHSIFLPWLFQVLTCVQIATPLNIMIKKSWNSSSSKSCVVRRATSKSIRWLNINNLNSGRQTKTLRLYVGTIYKRSRVLNIDKGKQEIPVGKWNDSRHSVWEASEKNGLWKLGNGLLYKLKKKGTV